MHFLRKFNNYCLFILVFSVTFENWDPFKLVGIVSITYMASILYILSWLPLLKSDFHLPPFRQYLLPLILLTIAGIVSTALNSGYAESVQDIYNQRVIMLIILMVLIANHLYNDNSLITKVLNVYLISIITMYFLVLLGAGTEFINGRLKLFGENPNSIGVKVVIAFLIVVARLINSRFQLNKALLNIFCCVATLDLIILTGSRGALISVFLGLMVLVWYMKINVWRKIALGVAGGGFSLLLLNYIMSVNAAFSERILNTIERGDTGREELWNAAWSIIENNLIMGVGLSGALPEMFRYTGRLMYPHNVFLYVLMTTGVVGLLFYLMFIFRLARNLYRTFKITGQVVFLVMLAVVIFNMAKSGGAINKIFFWFFFAILIGSTFMPEVQTLTNSNNQNEH